MPSPHASRTRRRRHRRRRRARPAPRPRYHLAQAGLDVLLLEKTAFPREKVCGDGLTPRAVKQLRRMGIDTSRAGRLAAQQGPAHHRRRHAARAALAGPRQLPGLRPGPHRGWTSTRCSPARRAKAGARLREQHHVTGPVLDERTGRIVGVDGQGRGRRREVDLPRAARRRRRRQLQPALRSRWACASATTARWASRSARYYTQPARTTTTGWSPGSSCGTASRAERNLLPGYGWIFGVGDGTVNVGLGILNTCTAFGKVDYKDLLQPLAGPARPRSGASATRTATAADPRRGAADGLQPQAALHPRPAARRRLRRHGQPVQRRGHRLRDGVRRARRRGHRRRRWPGPTPAGARAGAAGYPQRSTGRVRRLLHARPAVREAHRPPGGHAAAPPGTACRTRR